MTELDPATTGGENSLRLVFLEEGGHFSCQRAAEDDTELFVVAQNHDERPVEFALRALRRIALLEQRSRFASEVVIAVGDGKSSKVVAARSLVAHALLHHLLQGGRGALTIGAGKVGAELQSQLMALAGELTTELVQTPISVNVRFRTDLDACVAA